MTAIANTRVLSSDFTAHKSRAIVRNSFVSKLVFIYAAALIALVCQTNIASAATTRELFNSAVQTLAIHPIVKAPEAVRARTALVDADIINPDTPPLAPNSEFQLNLFNDASYSAVVVRSDSPESGRWTVNGVIRGMPHSQFILTCNNGALMGSVFVPSRGHFKIESRGTADCTVSELDHTLSGRCATCAGLAGDLMTTPSPTSQIRTLSIPPERPPTSNSVYIVDIMVVYTPAALNGAGGTNPMNSLIDLAMAEANTIYQNSDANVRFRLVYRGLVNYTEFPNLSTNLNRLRIKDDGYLDEVHGLRTTNRADLVSLITESADAGFAGLAFTPVKAPPLPNFAEKAFSVVQRSQAVGTFTFAHEISHNMGCQHDREHSLDATGTNIVQGSYTYSFGHRFTANGTVYRDVMSYDPGIQIPYLSTPRLNFLGVPMGITVGLTNEADNVQTVNLNAIWASQLVDLPVLTFPPLVTLTAPTTNLVLKSGTNVTLTATASDPDLLVGAIKQVEFFADFTFLGTVTNSPYTMVWTNVPAGTYSLTARAVDNSGASAAAMPVALIVRPNNDDFTNAIVISGSSIHVEGSTLAATSQTGEPVHTHNPGGKSVWYQWSAPKAGTVNIAGSGEQFLPLLGIYTGTSISNLVDASSAVSFGTNSVLTTFDAKNAKTYWIAVDGLSGNAGLFQFDLSYQGPPANDDLTNRVVLDGDDVSIRANNLFATLENGEPNKYAGNTADKSVWYSWTAARSGPVIVAVTTTNFLTLPDIFIGTNVSQLAPGDAAHTTVFDQARFTSTMTFEAVSNRTYSIVVAGLGGASGWFDLSLLMPPAPGNDNFESASPQFGTAWSLVSSNQYATLQSGEPQHDTQPGSRSVWYSWSAPRKGQVILTASATLTNFTPLLDVYTGTNLSQLSAAANRTFSFDNTNKVTTVTFVASGNTTYSIALAGFGDRSGGLFGLQLFMPPTPDNDDFANAIVTTGTTWTVTGTNSNASAEPGEPSKYAANFGGNSVWYSWTAPRSGPVTVTANVTNFVGLLDVFTGTNVSQLTQVSNRVVTVDNPKGVSVVTFDAVETKTYSIVLAGFFNGITNGAGPYSIQLFMPAPPDNDNFTNRIELSGLSWSVQGVNTFATLEPGEPKHADPNPSGKSMWYSWTAPVSGPVLLTAEKAGNYPLVDVYAGNSLTNLVRVSDPYDFTTFTNAGVKMYRWICPFTAVYNRTYAIALAGIGTSSGTNTLTLVAANLPPAIQLPIPVGQGQSAFGFKVSGSANTKFLLQSTTNLINWPPGITNTFTTNVFTITDTNYISTPARFFRIFPLP